VRARLLTANLLLILVLLVALELPLGLLYSRHEHEALETSLDRDATALAALGGRALAGPNGADLLEDLLVPGELVAVAGATLTPRTTDARLETSEFDAILQAARRGEVVAGEVGGLVFVAKPFPADAAQTGAALVARPDAAIDARARRFWTLLVLAGVVVLGVAAGLTERTSGWIARPLRRLDAQAAAFGRGDLESRLELGSAPPEVHALVATFNRMAAQLADVVRSQRRFVADASHQLRTPLTAVRLRLENLDATEPAHFAAARDAALEELARLSRLVDGLLVLARAEGASPDLVVVDVAAVLRDRQLAWAPLAEEQGVTLVVADGEPEAPVRMADGHLEQILDNLIDNALEATSSGGTVRLSTSAVGDATEVHVTDDGPGMSEDDMSHAFRPFWRRARPGGSDGTGLGLAIVEQLARANGGAATLRRTADGGTDAVISLPSAS
jgi:signal transduction histidine kinase